MKDRYKIMRQSNMLDVRFLYDYALSKGLKRCDLHFFSQAFSFSNMNVEELLSNLDKEFDLTTVHDSTGRVVKTSS
jgi:hypothetical protein